MGYSLLKNSYPSGNVGYDQNTDNAVFIPNNVTNDTPVYIYYTGDIGNANQRHDYKIAPEYIANKYFNDPNFNGIVIINNYKNDFIYSDNYLANSVRNNQRIVNNIEKQYGVTLNNRSAIGSSAGDRFALKDFAEEAKNGTDNGYCVITGASVINVKQGFDYNGRIKGGNDPNRAFLSKEDYEAIKGKTVFVFEGSHGSDYTYVNALAENGVNVISVECGNGGHDALSYKPLQDNLFGLLAGDNEALEEFMANNNYTFKKCVDPKNNRWEKATIEEIREYLVASAGLTGDYKLKHDFSDLNNKINGLKNLANDTNEGGEIKSDDDYVASSVNKILAIISKTNLLNVSASSSCESTTKVPPVGLDYLYEYTDTVTSLLDKLARECQASLTIAEHINDTDWLLKHEAEMAFNMNNQDSSTNADEQFNDVGNQNSNAYGSGSNAGNGSDNNSNNYNNGVASNPDIRNLNGSNYENGSSNRWATPLSSRKEFSQDNYSYSDEGDTSKDGSSEPRSIGTQETKKSVDATKKDSLDKESISPIETKDIDKTVNDISKEVLTGVSNAKDLVDEEQIKEIAKNKKSFKGLGLLFGAAAAGGTGYKIYKDKKKKKEEGEKQYEEEMDELTRQLHEK